MVLKDTEYIKSGKHTFELKHTHFQASNYTCIGIFQHKS